MGIFNKPPQQTTVQTNTTVISGSTSVEGTIESGCPLHIDGSHRGTVISGKTVTIGAKGRIEGELSANTLSVTGQFMGTADCDNVEIHAGGILRGKVISNNLTIDQDCTFEGESVKKPRQVADISAQQKPQPSAREQAQNKAADQADKKSANGASKNA